MNFNPLSREDLLVKLECGKDKAYIQELELKIAGKIKDKENVHIQ